MDSLILAALIAAAPAASSAAVAPLDRSCFALMAELAEDRDPRLSSAGRVAAHYFLGRIDAAAPDFDPASARAPAAGPERERLLRLCGEALQAGGRDFRAIGDSLRPARPAV